MGPRIEPLEDNRLAFILGEVIPRYKRNLAFPRLANRLSLRRGGIGCLQVRSGLRTSLAAEGLGAEAVILRRVHGLRQPARQQQSLDQRVRLRQLAAGIYRPDVRFEVSPPGGQHLQEVELGSCIGLFGQRQTLLGFGQNLRLITLDGGESGIVVLCCAGQSRLE